FYVAKYVNKKSDMDLAAKGLGAKEWNNSDRKSGSAGMPRPISYAVFCLKKKILHDRRLIVFAERIERLDLLGRETAIADHLECANLVARTFADGDVDQPFSTGSIDDQRVLENSEINVAATCVELRNLLAEVLGVFRI